MNTLIARLLLILAFAVAVRAAEEPPSEPSPEFSPVVLALPEGAPFPQARVDSIDRTAGTFTFAWLNAEGVPTDSGNSIGRFTPGAPAAEGELPPLPDNETLTASIVATCTP